MKKKEASDIAHARREESKNVRVEPKMGVPGDMLFSHGPEFSLKFGASMTGLHFSDPAARAYGADSNDRVHKSFFYGSKHIDAYVPKVAPNERVELMSAKQAQWAAQKAAPLSSDDMYATTNKIMYAK